MAATANAAQPWHAHYPPPKNLHPSSITPLELLDLIRAGQKAGKDFLLVDLRRNDHEGGTIHGSINLPAQSMYSSIPVLYDLFSAAPISKVIFYCSSSRGRGNRAAGWFDDYIVSQQNVRIKSLVLTGGISAWAGAGEAYTLLMDDYDPCAWKQ